MAPIKETVGYAIAQLCKLHRNTVDAALRQAGEIHVGQEMILLQLWDAEGQTQTQLAELLCVEAPTITKMLQRMESEALITRRPDAEDARVSRVYLAQRGGAVRDAIERSWEDVEQRLTRGMTTEERLLFRRLLLQARTNLAE
ncbi:MAG: MarR family transcriptional regulator [Kouleothrix sp.]|jgi:DNA-binding MarR family transcriptional regulator|nr:MarR family transcriptional regulator [Kouleothrix sp.]